MLPRILILGGLVATLRPTNTTAEDIGHFGVATLFSTAALLPISVMTQRALPLITATSEAEQHLMINAFNRRMLTTGLAIALFLMAFLFLLWLFDTGDYGPALLAATGLMIAVPMKAVASAIGTVMLAKGELRVPVWITLGELAAISLVFICIQPTDAVWTAVLSVIVGSATSMLAMLVTKHS